MPAIPTVEPTSFAAGDTVQWTVAFADYPATTWTVTYYFRGASKQSVQATASGTNHAVTIAATTSAAWTPGEYWWEAYAVSGSERHRVNSGRLTVGKNFSVSDEVFDGRTHVQITLEAIEAVIENRATSDQQAYTIAGRSLQRMPIRDLLFLRERYSALYAAEQRQEAIARGESGNRKILARI